MVEIPPDRHDYAPEIDGHGRRRAPDVPCGQCGNGVPGWASAPLCMACEMKMVDRHRHEAGVLVRDALYAYLRANGCVLPETVYAAFDSYGIRAVVALRREGGVGSAPFVDKDEVGG